MVTKSPFINLKDFTLKVPGSQADCTLQPCLRELVFALFSGKVPGSTQSAWEPGSQIPRYSRGRGAIYLYQFPLQSGVRGRGSRRGRLNEKGRIKQTSEF